MVSVRKGLFEAKKESVEVANSFFRFNYTYLFYYINSFEAAFIEDER